MSQVSQRRGPNKEFGLHKGRTGVTDLGRVKFVMKGGVIIKDSAK